MTTQTTLAIIGGSGLYSMQGLQNTKELHIDTPFGKPSAPYGDRKYDLEEGGRPLAAPLPIPRLRTEGNDRKPVVASVSLAGCFGCHMSLLDCDTEILDILEVVDLGRSPLTDIKEFTQRADIGLIEGGCCNSENVEVLREFRRNCDVLVAVGECAIWGGLPAMRNTVPLRECLEETYLHSVTSEGEASVIPRHEDIPKILNKVYACSEIVDIDYFVPLSCQKKLFSLFFSSLC